uniref:Uncharacterized protein n=1 Tax=Anguilla anguilla TaxID=7936 RepID=A0A0E9VDM5_ANGAN
MGRGIDQSLFLTEWASYFLSYIAAQPFYCMNNCMFLGINVYS